MAEQERRFIRKEEAIKAGPLKLDYKLVWMGILLVLCVIMMFASMVADAIVWGLVFTVATVVFYFVFIGISPFEQMRTTLLAKLYRRGVETTRDLTGMSEWTSDQAGVGEFFGKVPDKKWRKVYFKPLGKINFFPFPTGRNEEGVEQAPLGIVQDRSQGTRSAVLWTAGSSLLGVGSSEQGQRQDAFARLLDMCAQLGIVHRIAWREQTLMGEPQQPDMLTEKLRSASKLQSASSPNLDVLKQRTIEMGEDSVVHRTTFVVTINKEAVKREAKALGSPEHVLVELLGSFYAATMGNDGDVSPLGLRAASFLSYNELLMETRLALDPVYAQPLWESWQGPQDPADLLSPVFAWPVYSDFKSSPDWARVGDTFHVGLFLDDYNPRGTLPKEYWNILEVRVPKVVTTIVQLVPPSHAMRRAEWAANSAYSGTIDATRVTASEAAYTNRTMRHETEIAEETGQVGRLRTYIDVTGTSPEEALANAAIVVSAATSGKSRFIVNRLTGRQHEGIAAAGPFGRGLAAMDLSKWA